MHGYDINHNKLSNSPGRESRVFSWRSGVVAVPRRYEAFRRCGGRSWQGKGAGQRGRAFLAGQRGRAKGQGKGAGGRGRGKAIFHALCVNCKENLAKTRIKTEISRKTRKFLPENLHKAKICRTFALSKRKTNKKIHYYGRKRSIYLPQNKGSTDAARLHGST